MIQMGDESREITVEIACQALKTRMVKITIARPPPPVESHAFAKKSRGLLMGAPKAQRFAKRETWNPEHSAEIRTDDTQSYPPGKRPSRDVK